MREILILSSSYLNRDPRVLRQIRALKDEYNITTCGIAVSQIEGVKEEHAILFRPAKNQPFFTRLSNYIKMKVGKYESLTWNNAVFNKLNRKSYDLIIVNDPREMALAVKLQGSTDTKIYFDIHEYYMQVDSSPLINNMYSSLLKKYYSKADIASTINQEVAELYEEQFGGKCHIVKNAGPYQEYTPTEIDTKSIKLIHHGVLNRDRKLEKMVDMINLLPTRYKMDFYLVGTDLAYLEELKNRVKNVNQVQFPSPVPFNQLVSTSNKYDIGVFILDPKVKSYELALPNKIFEFIQARLAIAISPNSSMKNLVEKWQNGVVADDYTSESMADKILNLETEDIMRMKENSAKAAKVENEELGVKEIKNIVKQLLK